MAAKLPKRLRKEPLLDALFECRFISEFPVSNMLPGIFFSAFEGEKHLERLPQADIPEMIRNNDPNLQFAPLLRIRMQRYSLLIGDKSVSVSCNLPYPGWADFKGTIIKTLHTMKESKLIEKVTRYSTKYVDLVQSSDRAEQVKLVNLKLKIGNHALTEEPYQVRMDVPTEGFVNIIQILSGAVVTLPNTRPKEGVVIDIDTIKDVGGVSIGSLEADLDSALEFIHKVNKKTFFDCLSPEALSKLEPEYE